MVSSTGNRLIAPQSVFTATATNHISYRVADYARMRDFYMDLLGMRCVYDDGTKCAVEFGSPARSLYIIESQAGADLPYVDHLAFSVADFDLESSKAALERWGFEPEYDGDHAWTIQDSEGFKVQICDEEGVFPGAARPDATTEGRVPTGRAAERPGVFRATAVNHVAYRVPDYARARDFYIDLLGMRVAFEDGLKCSVAFGDPEDALYIMPSGDAPAHVDHLAFSVADFDLDSGAAELRNQGHDPEDDGSYAWTIWDPEGYKIQICAETGVYPGARRDPYHNPASRGSR